MKYHIAVKFLAILLCAGALLGVVSSAAGMVVLLEANLYERSFQTAYEGELESTASILAGSVARDYATVNLGGCSEDLAAACQNWENGYIDRALIWERYGYTLRDENGQVLSQKELSEGQTVSYTSTVNVQGYSYTGLISEITREEYDRQNQESLGAEWVSTSQGAHCVHNAVPQEGADVYAFELEYADGSNVNIGSPISLARVSYDEEGMVSLTYEGNPESLGLWPVPEVTAPTAIRILGVNDTLLYEANGQTEVAQSVFMTGERVVLRLWPEAVIDPSLSLWVYEDVPLEGAEVSEITLTYADGSSSGNSASNLGALTYENSQLVFSVTGVGGVAFDEEQPVTQLTLSAPDGQLLYQAKCPDGLGSFTGEADGQILSLPVTELASQAVEAPADETPGESATLPESGEYVFYSTQAEDGTWIDMVALVEQHDLPAYTVEVTFAPSPLAQAWGWELLEVLYSFKDQLLPLLLGSLLAFGVISVYLCCAAGRTPKAAELRAGGLNRTPLDLYLVILALPVVGLVALAAMAFPQITSINILAPLVVLAAYLVCMLVVAFFFAFTAQVKTPGSYLWKNLLITRCFTLVIRWCRALLGWMLGSTGYLRKILRWVWRLLKQMLRFCREILSRWGQGLALFFRMLPLTWQWMIGIFGPVFLLVIALAGRYDALILLALALAAASMLYSAYCFGTLLASAQRMRGGDLDTKVEDRLLIGCFKDFAEELNGLADVAVIAAQKQLKSERMKTELITNVSHDIKTPLTSIINYVDLLEKPHTPEQEKIYLEVLDRQSMRLKKLIEDLIEMSKANTGNMTVDITRVDAAESVNQALGEFADKLSAAQLTPVFRRPEEPVYMLADGRLVWRVMSNLLSNAVKYALPGTRLYLDLMAVEGKVIISIKNISREELHVDAEELLERFVRGDDSRNTEGSGLGLNIAKSLMELQKGQLQLLIDGDLFKVTLILPQA